jgi:hypothetical protein
MSSVGAAPRAAVSVSNARAEASRKNGAKSRGPRTPEGKARSARNALKHGLRAEKYFVLADEDRSEFAALEAALEDELVPEGALQRFLARRVACAAWRLMRAERLEVELFAERRYGACGVGLALIRDGNCTRSFETLLRYRGAAQAELWRALRTLKALQAEPSSPIRLPAPAALPSQGQTCRLSSSQPGLERGPIEPKRRHAPCEPPACCVPDQPERRGPHAVSGCLDPREFERGGTPDEAPMHSNPTEPEPRGNRSEMDRRRMPDEPEEQGDAAAAEGIKERDFGMSLAGTDGGGHSLVMSLGSARAAPSESLPRGCGTGF